MIKVGIIGCGVIGDALRQWLQENNSEVKVFVNDPYKGYTYDLYSDAMDAYFIQIHLPTNEDGTQSTDIFESIIKKIQKSIPIWIRTTILPSTLETLRKINPDVNYMPEFLTERTSKEDFNTQKMVFTGKPSDISLLEKIFPNKEHIVMNSMEAVIAKYSHNVFGALKVTYFNTINEMCNKLGIDYKTVLKGILLSGYINDTHTMVPGPDGKYGYGGKCFPKDVKAFQKFTEGTDFSKLLNNVITLNEHYRNS